MAKFNKLYIMVGVPGSGKSTWIDKHKAAFKTPYKIVSRDKIRFSLVSEDEPYFSKEDEVFKVFIKEIKDGLADGLDVYADATHLSGFSRGKLLRALGSSIKDTKIEAIVIKTSLNTAITQNNLREGRSFVPKSVVRRMYTQLEEPTLEEGFDKIWIYQNENNNENRYIVYQKED